MQIAQSELISGIFWKKQLL